MLTALLLVLATYVFGSIPTGYWLVKALKGIDIRTIGSGSTGATNVYRAAGKTAGIAVLVLDVLKGYFPTLISIWVEANNPSVFGAPDALPVVIAVEVMIAHSKSIFLKFQGGKSAATGLGTLIAFNPWVGLATFVTWVAVVAVTRLVSLASILGVAMCVVYMWLITQRPGYTIFCVFGFLIVTIRHKANIKRMMEGTEPKFGQKPKAATDAAPDAAPEAVQAAAQKIEQAAEETKTKEDYNGSSGSEST